MSKATRPPHFRDWGGHRPNAGRKPEIKTESTPREVNKTWRFIAECGRRSGCPVGTFSESKSWRIQRRCHDEGKCPLSEMERYRGWQAFVRSWPKGMRKATLIPEQYRKRPSAEQEQE